MFQVLLCITNNSIKHQSFVYTQLNDLTDLFLTIQFSINHFYALSFNVNSIWPIDRTLSGATTLGQSGPGSDGNEGVLCIPQSSSINLYLYTQTYIYINTHFKNHDFLAGVVKGKTNILDMAWNNLMMLHDDTCSFILANFKTPLLDADFLVRYNLAVQEHFQTMPPISASKKIVYSTTTLGSVWQPVIVMSIWTFWVSTLIYQNTPLLMTNQQLYC